MVKRLFKGKKQIFFFYNLFHIFPLPLRKKKQNHLLFPPFLSPEIRKGQGKTTHRNFFFFFFLTFLCTLPLFVFGKITTYLFFSKFRLKLPKTADQGAQVSFFTNYLFSPVITRTHTPTHTNSVFPTHNA